MEIQHIRHERLVLCKYAFIFEEVLRHEEMVNAVSILPWTKYTAKAWLMAVEMSEMQKKSNKEKILEALNDIKAAKSGEGKGGEGKEGKKNKEV